ncbi:uncharacterized protein Non2 [Atheta coriaria]|uniref:uncharacterized protein Non2 n=1 Tax=Dalotia coriaria TaxID=877792 RepID=UPI0031F46E00
MADISKQALRKEIAAILKGADLADTSAKNVRQELEEKLDCKLIARKKEIDEMVMEYVSNAADKKGKKKDSEEEDEEDEEDEQEEKETEEDEDSEEDKKPVKRASSAKKPPAKRPKKDSDDSDEGSDASGDASEEEYKPVKRASTGKPRGRKPAPKKKKGSDSDGDEDWVQEKPAPRKTGAGGGAGKGKGYTRPLTLSPELAALVGQEVMARHEVIKKMWSIIKEKNLYDPKNKQFAICDEAMQKVIGVKRFRMFGMMKYLKDHFIA